MPKIDWKSIPSKLTVLSVIMIGLAVGAQRVCWVRKGASLQDSRSEEQSSLAWFKNVPPGDQLIFDQILKYRKAGDYEAAIALASTGVDGKPPDDFLLQTIADSYFERMQDQPSKRAEWVPLAIEYSTRALAANPDDIVNVFNLGKSYELGGMNTHSQNSCSYYTRSLELFEDLRRHPALMNESAVVEGEHVRTGPYRQRLVTEISKVSKALANCQSRTGNK